MVLEKQRSSFLGGGYGGAREYSEQMAQDMDAFIKRELQEHYQAVVARLELYRGAIENMVVELYEKENIDGDLVRKIIKDFEADNGLESLVVDIKSTDEKLAPENPDGSKRE
jgi:cell division protease FtsH